LSGAVASGGFSLRALHDALDAARRARGMSWSRVAAEVNRHRTYLPRIAASTISGLRDKSVAEGDGVLQMLLWLGKSPEAFVPGHTDADAERFQLPELTTGQILRWDTRTIHAELDGHRRARGMTWVEIGQEIGGCTPSMLTGLGKGGRAGLPHVMRLVLWLDRPAVTFTRIADW
jgi:hypothetical protein